VTGRARLLAGLVLASACAREPASRPTPDPEADAARADAVPAPADGGPPCDAALPPTDAGPSPDAAPPADAGPSPDAAPPSGCRPGEAWSVSTMDLGDSRADGLEVVAGARDVAVVWMSFGDEPEPLMLTLHLARVRLDDRSVRSGVLAGPGPVDDGALAPFGDGYLVVLGEPPDTVVRVIGPDDLGEGAPVLFRLPDTWPGGIATQGDEIAVTTADGPTAPLFVQRASADGTLGARLPLEESGAGAWLVGGGRSVALAWDAWDGPGDPAFRFAELAPGRDAGFARKLDAPPDLYSEYTLMPAGDDDILLRWYPGPEERLDPLAYRITPQATALPSPVPLPSLHGAEALGGVRTPRGLVVTALDFVDRNERTVGLVLQRFDDAFAPVGPRLVVAETDALFHATSVAQSGPWTLVAWSTYDDFRPHLAFVRPCIP
jgi:hypothetical protein